MLRDQRIRPVLVALLGLLGCEADGPEAPALTADLFVPTVHHSGERDTVRALPAFGIGREGDPRYEFQNVVFVGEISDGRVVVADAGTGELRFYTGEAGEGEFLASFGGPGEGPGEFQRLARVNVLSGDTLAISDVGLNRLTFVSPDGYLLASRPYAHLLAEVPRPDGSCPAAPTYLGMTDDDVLVFLGHQCWAVEGTEGIRHVNANILLFDGERTAPSAIAGPFVFGTTHEDPSAPLQASFIPLPAFGGSAVALLSGGFAVSDPTTHEILVFSSEGGPLLRIRDEVRREAVGPHVRLQLEEGLSRFPGVSPERLRRLPFPDSLPALTHLVAGADQLWAGHQVRRGEEWKHWTAYREEGALLGTVAIPANFQLRSVSPAHLLGITRDSLGVQTVQVYRNPFRDAR